MKKENTPIAFSEELADQIICMVMDAKSMREICVGPKMPSKRTLLNWLADPLKAEFTNRYAQAKRLMADDLFDEILDLADNEPATTQLDLERLRIKIDARKWMASKLLPKKYGNFKAVEISGQLEQPTTDLSKLSYDELYKLKYGVAPSNGSN